MRGDIKTQYQLDPTFSIPRIVEAGVAGSIKAGEPTKEGSNGAVVIMVDGDGTTTQRFSGIAKSDSTDTVAAAGVVYNYIPLAGLTYIAKAKSAAAANTQAEIDALQGKRVVFDLTSTRWTIDTAAADSATNGVVIVGGAYQTSEIFFMVSPSVTFTE